MSEWIVFRAGSRWGRASSLKAAMNLVDRPWAGGYVTIRGPKGETWCRRRGQWEKLEEPAPTGGNDAA